MLEILRDNPYLILIGVVMLVPITAIIFGTMTSYLRRVRQAELEASLKQEMLQRGMSAEEIKLVIEATSQRKSKHCNPHSVV